MNHDEHDIDIDIRLSFGDLVRAERGDEHWVLELIAEDAIHADGAPQQAVYSGYQLARLRRAGRIRRDFDAGAAATALILDLLDELEDLRRRV